jgi:LEA14-like dessication related protein
MNTLSKGLLIVGGGLASYALLNYAYRNVILVGKLDYKIVNVQITNLLPTIEGFASIVMTNKSQIGVDVRNVDLKLFLDNVEIGSVLQTKPTSIKPDGQSIIKGIVRIEAKNIVDNAKQLFSTIKMTSDMPVDLVGNLEIKSILGWVKIPVTYSTTGKSLKALYDEYYK